MAIYQARFNHYIRDRHLKDLSKSKVWCFMGDGEVDEPESLGAITLALGAKSSTIWSSSSTATSSASTARCAVNGKIIQELEAAFRGAGWNVIKVVWGSEWDAFFERDDTGLLVQRMNEVVDGEEQKYTVESGQYVRDHFFGKYPELLKLFEHLKRRTGAQTAPRRATTPKKFTRPFMPPPGTPALRR